jgi:hypothetical protein
MKCPTGENRGDSEAVKKSPIRGAGVSARRSSRPTDRHLCAWHGSFPRRAIRDRYLWLLSGILLLTTLFFAFRPLIQGTKEKDGPLRFSLLPPQNVSRVYSITLSPDGRRIAFIADNQQGRSSLWLHTFDSAGAQQLMCFPERGASVILYLSDTRNNVGSGSRRLIVPKF